MRVVTRDEMRAIDRWTIDRVGIPSIVLMENAGRGVAEIVLGLRRSAEERLAVAVLCGPGSNGGDGFVAARHLRNAGQAVTVLLAGAPEAFDRPGDAGTNLLAARRMGLPVGELRSDADLQALSAGAGRGTVVDALFGTGLSRPVVGFHRALIETVNGLRAPVVAVDVPSGLDADRGVPLGAAVRATVTAALGFPKAGFSRGEGPAYCGEVRVVDIGIPRDTPAWDGIHLLM